MTIEATKPTTVLTDAATTLTPEEQFAADFAADPAPPADDAAAAGGAAGATDPALDAVDPAATAANPAAADAGAQTTTQDQPETSFEQAWAEGDAGATADTAAAPRQPGEFGLEGEEFASAFNAQEAAK